MGGWVCQRGDEAVMSSSKGMEREGGVTYKNITTLKRLSLIIVF